MLPFDFQRQDGLFDVKIIKIELHTWKLINSENNNSQNFSIFSS